MSSTGSTTRKTQTTRAVRSGRPAGNNDAWLRKLLDSLTGDAQAEIFFEGLLRMPKRRLAKLVQDSRKLREQGVY